MSRKENLLSLDFCLPLSDPPLALICSETLLCPARLSSNVLLLGKLWVMSSWCIPFSPWPHALPFPIVLTTPYFKYLIIRQKNRNWIQGLVYDYCSICAHRANDQMKANRIGNIFCWLGEVRVREEDNEEGLGFKKNIFLCVSVKLSCRTSMLIVSFPNHCEVWRHNKNCNLSLLLHHHLACIICLPTVHHYGKLTLAKRW